MESRLVITNEDRRNHLDRLVEAWDRIFDPEIIGLRHPGPQSPRPLSSGGEESLHYALALLELAERSRLGRAEAIVNRLVEATVPSGVGTLTLSLIWHRHRRRLPAALIEKIVLNLVEAANCIRYQDTNEKCPSPSDAINEIFVLLTAALILGDEALRSHAISRLDTHAKQACQTILSSREAAACDLAVALAGFRAIDTYIHGADAPARIEATLQHFQNESIPALQTDSGKIPGRDLLLFLVENAITGIQCGSPDSGQRTFAALYACVMKIESPLALRSDESALPAS